MENKITSHSNNELNNVFGTPGTRYYEIMNKQYNTLAVYSRAESLKKNLPIMINNFSSEIEKIENGVAKNFSFEIALTNLTRIAKTYKYLLNFTENESMTFKTQALKLIAPCINNFFSRIQPIEQIQPFSPTKMSLKSQIKGNELSPQINKNISNVNNFLISMHLRTEDTNLRENFYSASLYLRAEILSLAN
jgi:hypothetical protein